MKNDLHRAARDGAGGWRHETETGELVCQDDPRIRTTDTVSFALNGAAATFSKWSEIVSKLEAAKQKYRSTGDELDLSTVYFTDIGIPYVAQAPSDSEGLNVAGLKDRMVAQPRGTAPSWVHFVTVTCDVQKTRFPVSMAMFS